MAITPHMGATRSCTKTPWRPTGGINGGILDRFLTRTQVRFTLYV
jgi:hypothetical protein